jgi:hypothetical protein
MRFQPSAEAEAILSSLLAEIEAWCFRPVAEIEA